MGYRKAMIDAGLQAHIRVISRLGVDRTPDWGGEAANQIFARRLPISAAVLNNDSLAPSFMAELRSRGIGIPDKISVIGMDDIPISEYQNPPLSTVHQNSEAIGLRAATVLLEKMENPQVTLKNIRFPVELVLRDSAAKFNGCVNPR